MFHPQTIDRKGNIIFYLKEIFRFLGKEPQLQASCSWYSWGWVGNVLAGHFCCSFVVPGTTLP